MKAQISIIGCGWLGLPLAEFLIAKGYEINGSTTSKSKLQILKNASINAFQIQLSENGISGEVDNFLMRSETVIINIPPGLRKNPNKNHVLEIEHLVRAIEAQHIKHVIYISSTSVFEDETHFPVIDSATFPNAASTSSKQLIAIEDMLKANTNFSTTIIRFGGLIDEHRHPAKYLSGRNNIPNPDAPVNLIHKMDCIEIIAATLEIGLWNKSINAVYPNHPTKQAYYSKYCNEQGLALPVFNTSNQSKGKIVESSDVERLLNYTFKHTL